LIGFAAILADSATADESASGARPDEPATQAGVDVVRIL
jgi:hypothetical protein